MNIFQQSRLHSDNAVFKYYVSDLYVKQGHSSTFECPALTERHGVTAVS